MGTLLSQMPGIPLKKKQEQNCCFYEGHTDSKTITEKKQKIISAKRYIIPWQYL